MLKTTPAIAAVLAYKQWTVAAMIERTASYRKLEPPKLTYCLVNPKNERGCRSRLQPAFPVSTRL